MIIGLPQHQGLTSLLSDPICEKLLNAWSPLLAQASKATFLFRRPP